MNQPGKSLLVPYYEHPSVRPAEWQALIAAAPRLHSVVLNPASGPGERPDPAFAAVAERLRAADVRVLGYTDTDYGRRPCAAVVRDLSRHRSWYGTDGAFLDQVASGIAEFAYYRRLATAARGLGCGTLALNHGTAPHPRTPGSPTYSSPSRAPGTRTTCTGGPPATVDGRSDAAVPPRPRCAGGRRCGGARPRAGRRPALRGAGRGRAPLGNPAARPCAR